MKRMINSIVLLITILLIGFCFLISLIPDVTLTSGATLGCYMIPAIMIIITMIIQIRKEKNIEQTETINNKWLKVLFVVYCLLLITILFLNNEYYDRQIIIFTCTKREKMILEHEFVKFNYVEL